MPALELSQLGQLKASFRPPGNTTHPVESGAWLGTQCASQRARQAAYEDQLLDLYQAGRTSSPEYGTTQAAATGAREAINRCMAEARAWQEQKVGLRAEAARRKGAVAPTLPPAADPNSIIDYISEDSFTKTVLGTTFGPEAVQAYERWNQTTKVLVGLGIAVGGGYLLYTLIGRVL